MEVEVELIGYLARLAGNQRKIRLEIGGEKPTILDLVKALGGRLGFELERNLAQILILLNGVEINGFMGLRTPLAEGDRLVFIPVSHGG